MTLAKDIQRSGSWDLKLRAADTQTRLWKCFSQKRENFLMDIHVDKIIAKQTKVRENIEIYSR